MKENNEYEILSNFCEWLVECYGVPLPYGVVKKYLKDIAEPQTIEYFIPPKDITTGTGERKGKDEQ